MFTTRSDKTTALPADLDNRRFTAPAPRRLWVCDVTDELIRQQGPWRTVEQVEPATLEWVWWWNNQRLHGELDMRNPGRT